MHSREFSTVHPKSTLSRKRQRRVVLDLMSPCILPRLLPHQVDHADRLFTKLFHFQRAIDTSTTGSGKTHVACAVAHRLSARHMVVLCPPAIQEKWNDIVHPEDSEVIPYSLLTSRASVRGYFEHSTRPGHRVVNLDLVDDRIRYKVVPMSKVPYVKPIPAKAYIFKRPKTLLVIDESQRVKNHQAQCSRATLALTHEILHAGGWVLMLSATPFDTLPQVPHLGRLLLQGRSKCDTKLSFAQRWIERVRDHPTSNAHMSDSEVLSKLLGYNEFSGISLRAHIEEMLESSTSQTSRILRQIADAKTDSVGSDLDFIMQPWTEYLLTFESPLPEHKKACLKKCMKCTRSFLCDALPNIISMMTMPQSETSSRFDTILFLENADVAASTEEWWTENLFHDIQCPRKLLRRYLLDVNHMPAPMTTPCGTFSVDETLYNYQNPSWSLGGKQPCEAWKQVMETHSNHPRAKEIRRMHALCHSFYVRKTEAKGGIDYETEHALHHPLMCIEMIKARHLLSLVLQLWQTKPLLHIVVMFNYLRPMQWFRDTLVNIHYVDTDVISGQCGSQARRSRILRHFSRSESKTRVLCCTIPTMKEGIDLHDTEGTAPRVTFIMASYSAMAMEQAKGRNHRAGSKTHAINCIVYGDFVMGGELEAALISRVRNRRDVMQSFLPHKPYTESVFRRTKAFVGIIDDVVAGKQAADIHTRIHKTATPVSHDASPLHVDESFRQEAETWLAHETEARQQCRQSSMTLGPVYERACLYLREATSPKTTAHNSEN